MIPPSHNRSPPYAAVSDLPPRFTHARHTANVVTPPSVSSQQSPHVGRRHRAQGPAAIAPQCEQRALGGSPADISEVTATMFAHRSRSVNPVPNGDVVRRPRLRPGRGRRDERVAGQHGRQPQLGDRQPADLAIELLAIAPRTRDALVARGDLEAAVSGWTNSRQLEVIDFLRRRTVSFASSSAAGGCASPMTSCDA